MECIYAVKFSACLSVYHVAILQNEQYQNKMKQSDERLLALVKAAMDVVVAIGLLQLAPKKVTPRVTGAFGFITSLISCYQVTSASVLSRCMCCSGMELQR